MELDQMVPSLVNILLVIAGGVLGFLARYIWDNSVRPRAPKSELNGLGERITRELQVQEKRATDLEEDLRTVTERLREEQYTFRMENRSEIGHQGDQINKLLVQVAELKQKVRGELCIYTNLLNRKTEDLAAEMKAHRDKLSEVDKEIDGLRQNVYETTSGRISDLDAEIQRLRKRIGA